MALNTSGLRSNVGHTNPRMKPRKKPTKAQERELELRRERGEVACCECRRLKLKCNKKIPCASCLRRGCPTICPNGSLATGQGSRFVLAKTDKLHNKLYEMSQRIRQLEDALRIAHGASGCQPHPMLEKELLEIKACADIIHDESEDDIDEDNYDNSEIALDEDARSTTNLSHLMGSIVISDSSESRFLGYAYGENLLLEKRTDRSEIMAPLDYEEDDASTDSLVDGFPFSAMRISREELFIRIREGLPSYARARTLAEKFLENFSWFFRPVDRDQAMNELIPATYAWAHSDIPPSPPEECESEEDPTSKASSIISAPKASISQLALTLAMLACGACVDRPFGLKGKNDNDEAQVYLHLARAAVCEADIFSTTNLDLVQAVAMLSAYDFYRCAKYSRESTWKLSGLSALLASSLSLHRDPEKLNLEPKIVNRRRSVFWELCHCDKWKSLGSGRPCTFRLEDIDCKFPEYDGSDPTSEDLRWRQHFTRDIIGPLSETYGTTRSLKYSEVHEFDRKIREFKLPGEEKLGSGSELRKHVRMLYKDMLMLFLHRGYFARAMLDHPEKPARSPFSPSFLAAYASAISLLRRLRIVFDTTGEQMLQFWSCWAHALSAGVILGTVASRATSANLSSTAFEELEQTIKLFERASSHYIVRNGLPILILLRDKALSCRESMKESAARNKVGPPSSNKTSTVSYGQEARIADFYPDLMSPEGEDLSPHIVKSNTCGPTSERSTIGTHPDFGNLVRGELASSTYTFADVRKYGAVAATEMSSFTAWQDPLSVVSTDPSSVPDFTSSNDGRVVNVYEQGQGASAQDHILAIPAQQSHVNQNIPLPTPLEETSSAMFEGLAYDIMYPPVPMDQDMGVMGVDWNEPGLRTVIESLAQPFQASSEGELFVRQSEIQGDTSSMPLNFMHNISSTVPPTLAQPVPLSAEPSPWEELLASQPRPNDIRQGVPQQLVSGASFSSAFSAGSVPNISQNGLGPTMLDSGISSGTVTGDGQPTAMPNLIPAGANLSQSDAMLLQAWRALGEIPDLADFGMGVDSMMDGPIDLFS